MNDPSETDFDARRITTPHQVSELFSLADELEAFIIDKSGTLADVDWDRAGELVIQLRAIANILCTSNRQALLAELIDEAEQTLELMQDDGE